MKLSDNDINEILSIVTKNGKGIRASKPKHIDAEPNTGRAAYVWRNVMFLISKNPVHHCIPVMADFYLCKNDFADGYKELSAFKKELDKIVDMIVETVPVNERHGLKRWAAIL